MSAAMVAAALPRACLAAAALAVILLLRRVLATVARRLALGAAGRLTASVQSQTLTVKLQQQTGGHERTLRVPLPAGNAHVLSSLLASVAGQLAAPAHSLTATAPNIMTLQDGRAVGAYARVTRRVHMSEGKGKPERTTLEISAEPLAVTAVRTQDGCARRRAHARGALMRRTVGRGRAAHGRAAARVRLTRCGTFLADRHCFASAAAARSSSSRCRRATRPRLAA
jgi:hypothetical protein